MSPNLSRLSHAGLGCLCLNLSITSADGLEFELKVFLLEEIHLFLHAFKNVHLHPIYISELFLDLNILLQLRLKRFAVFTMAFLLAYRTLTFICLLLSRIRNLLELMILLLEQDILFDRLRQLVGCLLQLLVVKLLHPIHLFHQFQVLYILCRLFRKLLMLSTFINNHLTVILCGYLRVHIQRFERASQRM